MDETGLENAAILLMSLGEEDAAEVLKHLTPKEVQGVGETIARMKSIPRERVENVLEHVHRGRRRAESTSSATPTTTSARC